ncbi:Single hybrid motif superfamily protein [Euphorbia peplus]|nr:Single hybrid motif superfamily protein [Euphorbia peplus]
MASCSLGVSNIKFSNLDFGTARNVDLKQSNGIKTWIKKKELQYAGLTTSYERKNMFSISCSSSLETEGATNKLKSFKDTKSSGVTSPLVPNSSEVKYLVTEICNTTDVAEFELRLAGFELYVRRDLPEKNKPQSAPAPAPLPAALDTDTSTTEPGINGSASSTSLVISKPAPIGRSQSFLDRATDEGFMILNSPRVGFFRRSRTIKGKRAPPSCKEKQTVKEGQVVCYIEQLGGELPIESDISGEVIKILREDGEPVGFGDALMVILPSFPGIKKLQ